MWQSSHSKKFRPFRFFKLAKSALGTLANFKHTFANPLTRLSKSQTKRKQWRLDRATISYYRKLLRTIEKRGLEPNLAVKLLEFE